MKYSNESIIEAVRTSTTRREVMQKIGMSARHSGYRNLNRRIERLGLDVSHFKQPAPSTLPRPVQLTCNDPNDAKITGTRLRDAMIATGMEYTCAMLLCPVTAPLWLGKPITIQVDHINGNWWDNRIENLRFLCPNCHSQTDTFGSRNRSLLAKPACADCGKSISSRSMRCMQCAGVARRHTTK